MSTLNKISLDGTVYDIGGANKLPVENFPVTGTNLNLIKTTEMGTHVYYVTRDSTFRYRVNGDTSWRYISGPGMVYSYKAGSDEDMDTWYDIMFYGTDKIVKYHRDYNDSFPKGYREFASGAEANANGIYHITADTTPINLTGNNDIGVVTDTSYITLSWIDYESSEPKTMELRCGTFILGSTNAAAIGGGDNVIIIKPTGEQYVIDNITSTTATITETTPTVVTSISSSSTDTEIPTAKCVYDAIQNLKTETYDKSEIDTKIADYKLLGDFAVITGNYAYEESVTDKEITLSYPTGFTRDNCVVISIMLGNTAIKTKPLGCNSVMTSNSTATGAVANSVVLFESDIRLKLRNLCAKDYVESTTPQIMSQELPNLEYKVVLMKIPTQE